MSLVLYYCMDLNILQKEILDLRLGKAKALANKRMGQAELALKHANVIHSRSSILLRFLQKFVSLLHD